MTLSPENEKDVLAAEYALGVLEGPELARAEALFARDDAFAHLVTYWQEKLSPLLDEVPAVEPPSDLLGRIEATLDEAPAAPSNVYSLEKRLNRWKAYSAAVTAMAAALLLALGLGLFKPGPAPQQPQPQRQPVLVANVAAEDRSAAFVVSFDPNDDTLLVSPAVATPAPGHDHELWLIPASGTPESLGLVASTSPHRIRVPAERLGGFRPDATIAISVEPVGGSPTGLPTGPVVATGKLSQV